MSKQQQEKRTAFFTKQQFLTATQFEHQKDLLNALLEEGFYTIEEVSNKIKEFLIKEVK